MQKVNKLFQIIVLVLLILTATGCSLGTNNKNTKYIKVEYRDSEIDINHERWDYLDTIKSSWINGAWYDKDNKYMIINLEGSYYNYCGVSNSVWDRFTEADSFGTDYNRYIKGNYDCRYNYMPEYWEHGYSKGFAVNDSKDIAVYWIVIW